MRNAPNQTERGRQTERPHSVMAPDRAERRLANGRRHLVALAFVMATAVSAASAQTSTSASFRLSHQTVDSSGGTASSANYRMTDCLGPEPEAGGRLTSSSFVLHAACAAAVPAGLAADDDDGDGVSNGTEEGAPNGGDGNGDGTVDSLQGQVTSLPAASSNGYITFEACGDMACSSICQASNVRALLEADLPQQSDRFQFPFGLLEFAVNCSPVNIRVLYHGSNGFVEVDYIKFGPNPPGVPPSEFYELPGVLFGIDAVGADDAVASARFTLTDGLIGDDTGVDGTIFDQGGPAVTLAAPVPVLNGVGDAVLILVLLMLAAVSFGRSGFEGRRTN